MEGLHSRNESGQSKTPNMMTGIQLAPYKRQLLHNTIAISNNYWHNTTVVEFSESGQD